MRGWPRMLEAMPQAQVCTWAGLATCKPFRWKRCGSLYSWAAVPAVGARGSPARHIRREVGRRGLLIHLAWLGQLVARLRGTDFLNEILQRLRVCLPFFVVEVQVRNLSLIFPHNRERLWIRGLRRDCLQGMPGLKQPLLRVCVQQASGPLAFGPQAPASLAAPKTSQVFRSFWTSSSKGSSPLSAHRSAVRMERAEGAICHSSSLSNLCSGIKVTRGPGTVALEQEPLLCAYKAVEAVLLPRQLLLDVAAQHDPQFWPLGSQRGAIVVDHVAAELWGLRSNSQMATSPARPCRMSCWIPAV